MEFIPRLGQALYIVEFHPRWLDHPLRVGLFLRARGRLVPVLMQQQLSLRHRHQRFGIAHTATFAWSHKNALHQWELRQGLPDRHHIHFITQLSHRRIGFRLAHRAPHETPELDLPQLRQILLPAVLDQRSWPLSHRKIQLRDMCLTAHSALVDPQVADQVRRGMRYTR